MLSNIVYWWSFSLLLQALKYTNWVPTVVICFILICPQHLVYVDCSCGWLYSVLHYISNFFQLFPVTCTLGFTGVPKDTHNIYAEINQEIASYWWNCKNLYQYMYNELIVMYMYCVARIVYEMTATSVDWHRLELWQDVIYWTPKDLEIISSKC